MPEEDVKKIAELEGKNAALTSRIEALEGDKDTSDDELESLKEELKGVNEDLEVYQREGKTVEEGHALDLQKKDDIIKAKDKTIAERDGVIIGKDKEVAKSKVLSEFPEVDPSWIIGDTEDEMRKSAEAAKTKLEEIVNKRLKESGKAPNKWDKAPGPGGVGAGGGGSGPSPDEEDAVKKELDDEKAKGTDGDPQKLFKLKTKLGRIQLDKR